MMQASTRFHVTSSLAAISAGLFLKIASEIIGRPVFVLEPRGHEGGD